MLLVVIGEGGESLDRVPPALHVILSYFGIYQGALVNLVCMVIVRLQGRVTIRSHRLGRCRSNPTHLAGLERIRKVRQLLHELRYVLQRSRVSSQPSSSSLRW